MQKSVEKVKIARKTHGLPGVMVQLLRSALSDLIAFQVALIADPNSGAAAFCHSASVRRFGLCRTVLLGRDILRFICAPCLEARRRHKVIPLQEEHLLQGRSS